MNLINNNDELYDKRFTKISSCGSFVFAKEENRCQHGDYDMVYNLVQSLKMNIKRPPIFIRQSYWCSARLNKDVHVLNTLETSILEYKHEHIQRQIY